MTNIGVFDTGLGGLTVLSKLVESKKANYFYFGDTLRVPYGNRPKDEIFEFSCDIVDFLEKFDIDYYVIACNTISVTCLNLLEEKYKKTFIPITDGGLKAGRSIPGDLLVLATKATVDSHFYRDNIEKVGKKVYEVAGYNLVDLIENNQIESPKMDESLEEYLDLANKIQIPNILLGCTHFPLIKDEIGRKLTYEVNIIDPADYILDKIETNDNDLKIKIFLSQKSKIAESIIQSLIKFDYSLTYVDFV
ncbi:glutamate racemase [Anaerococcus sp. AGMB09787]|uniref:glutamate racemase n=1 Tax=Anaerococcus sp. AGMB09787 TaxID=2922869 RepID=UPI001FAED330|nr:glutamate racemase [Anaerococcus sp. AGMB09787]